MGDEGLELPPDSSGKTRSEGGGSAPHSALEPDPESLRRDLERLITDRPDVAALLRGLLETGD